VLAMILTMQRLGKSDRDIFLFDTFDGMTDPTEADRSFMNQSARELLAQGDRDTSWIWAKSGIE